MWKEARRRIVEREDPAFSWHEKATLIEVVWRAFVVNVHLVLYAPLALSSVMLFWLLKRDHPLNAYWKVDMARNETMIYRRFDLTYWEQQYVDVPFAVPFNLFLPVTFLLLVQASLREWVFVMSVTLGMYFVSTFIRDFLGTFAWIGPHFVTAAAFWWILPKNSGIPFHVIVFGMLLSGGIVMLYVLQVIPGNTELNRALIACVVLPVFREIFYCIVRFSTKRLTIYRQVGGDQVHLHRERTWPLFLFFQISMATFIRLYFLRFDRSKNLGSILLLQSIIEIILRLTMPVRDRTLFKLISCMTSAFCKSRIRQRASIVMPSIKYRTAPVTANTGTRPEMDYSSTTKAASSEARRRSLRCVQSMIMVGEQLSEYVGIFLSPVLVWVFRNHRLAVPFDYYLTLDDPFTGPLPIESMLLSSALQLLTEFITDIVCCIFELKSGYPISFIWSGRHRFFWLSFIFTNHFAAVLIFVLSVYRDRFDSCHGVDFCFCVDQGIHGFTVGGFLEAYCKHIYPPCGKPP